MKNKVEPATAVMINAGGTDTDKYLDTIFDCLTKQKKPLIKLPEIITCWSIAALLTITFGVAKLC